MLKMQQQLNGKIWYSTLTHSHSHSTTLETHRVRHQMIYECIFRGMLTMPLLHINFLDDIVCILIIWSSGFADPNVHSNIAFLSLLFFRRRCSFHRVSSFTLNYDFFFALLWFCFNRIHQINLNGLKIIIVITLGRCMHARTHTHAYIHMNEREKKSHTIYIYSKFITSWHILQWVVVVVEWKKRRAATRYGNCVQPKKWLKWIYVKSCSLPNISSICGKWRKQVCRCILSVLVLFLFSAYHNSFPFLYGAVRLLVSKMASIPKKCEKISTQINQRFNMY